MEIEMGMEETHTEAEITEKYKDKNYKMMKWQSAQLQRRQINHVAGHADCISEVRRLKFSSYAN